jgi:hypothetical protein
MYPAIFESEQNWMIKTVVKDRNSLEAQKLSRMGVYVIEGNPFDRQILINAMTGVLTV